MATFEKYRVKAGDKWSTVAKKFRTTASELAMFNDRSSRSRLKLGEIIRIPVPAEDLLLKEVRTESVKFQKLNKKLVSDASFRTQFLKSPDVQLKKMGIAIDPELLPSDFPVLRLMNDRKFAEIARKKNVDDIRKFLEKNYPDLVPDHVKGPAHVADAVEAVAVALPAVAVADPII